MSPAKASTALFSHSRLTATIGKGTVFGILSSATQLGTRLITVPVVIHHLGLDGYGIWSIIMVTAAYMRFGSAGIKSAFQKYVAEATGTGDFETANRRLSTGSITILALSAIVLIPIWIFSQKLAKASGVPPEFLFAAGASISVLALIYVVSNFAAAFEAIVMGGHRIDLTRKYSAVLAICEAVAIIGVLHLGYGLLAMTWIMGISELIYFALCYVASRRVVPAIQISMAHFARNVLPELIRYAGSYQLVNVLEVAYGAAIPIMLLKLVGANAAGIYALAGRVVSAALIAQDALVLPMLSAGTVVFASGSMERARLFLAKSFKLTLTAAILPLAFVAAFGTKMIFAWTGAANPQFSGVLWLTAIAALLRAISLLQLVLYRASGRATLDNVRQVLRIVGMIIVGCFGKRLGFTGLLAGMAGAELAGMIFMFFAMATTFQAFSLRMFASDALRISTATALMVGFGAVAGMIPLPFMEHRLGDAVRVCEIALGCLIVVWPALLLTKSVSAVERRAVLDVFMSRGRTVLAVGQ